LRLGSAIEVRPPPVENCRIRISQLPAPRIDPSAVAEAIVKAAAKHTRDVRVGAMAVANTVVAKVAPSWVTN
jgi:hypothetical protein